MSGICRPVYLSAAPPPCPHGDIPLVKDLNILRTRHGESAVKSRRPLAPDIPIFNEVSTFPIVHCTRRNPRIHVFLKPYICFGLQLNVHVQRSNDHFWHLVYLVFPASCSERTHRAFDHLHIATDFTQSPKECLWAICAPGHVILRFRTVSYSPKSQINWLPLKCPKDTDELD